MKHKTFFHFYDERDNKCIYSAQCRDLGYALAHAEGLAASLNSKVRLSWIRDNIHHSIVVVRPCKIGEDGTISEHTPDPMQLDLEDGFVSTPKPHD